MHKVECPLSLKIQRKVSIIVKFGYSSEFSTGSRCIFSGNRFIYDRTFGQDAESTADYISTVVTTMNEEGISSTLKHFPGYGNNEDTHTGIAYDNRPMSTFESSDFLPIFGRNQKRERLLC